MKKYLLLTIIVALVPTSCKKDKVIPDAPLIGTWSIQSEITSYYNGKSKLVRKDTLPSEFIEFREITITEKSFKWLEDMEEGYIGSRHYTLSNDSLKNNYIELLNGNNSKYQYMIKANILKLTNVVRGFYKPDEEPNYGIHELIFIRKE